MEDRCSNTYNRHLSQVSVFCHLVYIGLRLFWKEESTKTNIVIFTILIVTYLVLVFSSTSMGCQNASVACTILMVLSWSIFFLYMLRFYLSFATLQAFSKHLVSKKKRRFVDARRGLDLDLSYITRQIIAMGFPTENRLEQQFRNPMDQVQTFFTSFHSGHYKVYNLCSERTYTQRSFEQEFHQCRFPDHNPCPLAQLRVICQDMESFCKQDRTRNVVAVHCKAGKGRTGLVVSSFLLHTRKCNKASEALENFAQKRTFDGKGVTIPSQIRYVHHYEVVMNEGRLRSPRWLRLTLVEVTPELAEDWRFQIMTHEEGVVFDSRSSEEGPPPLVEGDVKMVFFFGREKLFQLWLHTAYDPKLCHSSSSACEPAAPSRTVVWASKGGAEASSRRPSYQASFKPEQLDGPHKKRKKKSGDKERGLALAELQLRFEGATGEEAHLARLELERRRAQRKREDAIQQRLNERSEADTTVQARKSRFRSHGASLSNPDSGDVEDYDDLEHDTDHEELLSILCRGYLLRSAGRCSRPQQRLCELYTSGRLHIAGGHSHFLSSLGTLVVDLAEDAENVLQEADDPNEEPRAWSVRNPRSHCWELLEAEDPREASRWEQGFADAVRLGLAEKDSNTIFCGFFWKLNSNADANNIPRSFEFAEWRIRLFVLKADGRMLVYSHKTKSEVVFCNFSDVGCELERLPLSWRGMPHIVLFQVIAGEDRTPRTLAASHEDFEAFAMRVSGLCRRVTTRPPGLPSTYEAQEELLDAVP
mmetsp:Transcript_98184/g.306287  ORF Transcript_98184/g.306287 Transcript_98184/m.306287 type:complete len:760 (-) Transcript_98184:101-2380(-)